jgi:hypothetical protein
MADVERQAEQMPWGTAAEVPSESSKRLTLAGADNVRSVSIASRSWKLKPNMTLGPVCFPIPWKGRLWGIVGARPEQVQPVRVAVQLLGEIEPDLAPARRLDTRLVESDHLLLGLHPRQIAHCLGPLVGPGAHRQREVALQQLDGALGLVGLHILPPEPKADLRITRVLPARNLHKRKILLAGLLASS